jgi:hypothetical protein
MADPVQTLLRRSGKVLAILSLSLVPTGSIGAQEQTAPGRRAGNARCDQRHTTHLHC